MFILWNVAYSAAYVALGVTAYAWYAVPLLVSIAIFTALGVHVIVSFLSRGFGGLSTEGRQGVALALLVIVAAPLYHSAREFENRPPYRTDLYGSTGDWLRTNTPLDASVGTLEVGIIGYTAHRTLIDFAGLIQPDIAKNADPALGFDGLALAAWQEYEPDFVAMLRPGIPAVTSDLTFQSRCRVVKTLQQPGLADVMEIFDCTGTETG